MRSLILVHGAGSGPLVFDGWPAAFPRVELEAVDLHAGLNVAEAAMSNYAAIVARTADSTARPLAICGWSMGGLAALMAAQQTGAERLVLLEPSPPGEVQGFDPEVHVEPGLFDPEEVYGPFPPGIPARPESLLARAERKRGVSVPSLHCPALVVYGDDYADERGRHVARFYGSDELFLPGLNHWDLVRDGRAAAAVAAWLGGEDPPPHAQ